MQKSQLTRIKPGEAEVQISHFTLAGLLPEGQVLALSKATRTLSLLEEGQLKADQQFSVNEMRILLPILPAFPHYCPYEVLLAHIASQNVSDHAIHLCRQRLYDARDQGSWQQELRPIRRALSSLRSKLHCFGLEISNIRERGCSLTSLTQPVPLSRRDLFS